MEELLQAQKVALPALLALIAASSCQSQPTKPTGAKVIDQILTRCHNMLRGTMADCYLELREAGGREWTKVVLGSGKLMLAMRPDGSGEVLIGAKAWGLEPGGDSTQLKGNARKRVCDLHALLAAALLEPLYRAGPVDCMGPTVYRIKAADGETWRLEVDPKTKLPKSLSGPAGTLTFDEHKATGVTFLPKLVTLGAFGKHELNLISSGFATNKTWFHSKVDKSVKPVDLGPLSAGGARTPTAPELQPVKARQSLRLPDPGDWERRVEVQNKQAWELYDQGQTGTDLTFFFQEKGQRYMAIPFEPDKGRGSRKFVPKKGQKILRRPGQVVAVVFPPRGTEQGVVEAGRKMLEKFLKQRQLRRTGVLRVIPLWAPENGVPDADAQAKLLYRLELPVAKK